MAVTSDGDAMMMMMLYRIVVAIAVLSESANERLGINSTK